MQVAILGSPKWQELEVTPSFSERFLANSQQETEALSPMTAGDWILPTTQGSLDMILLQPSLQRDRSPG